MPHPFDGELRPMMLTIALLHIRDGVSHKLLEHRVIKIRKALEVQAAFPHLVLAELGQQQTLRLSSCSEVDHDLATTDSKSCQRGLACPSAFVGVAVTSITNNAGPPHFRSLPGNLLEQSHQFSTISMLLLVSS